VTPHLLRKFPQGTKHPQCDEYIQAEIEKMNEALFFGGDQTLLEKYRRLKGKI